MPISQDVLGVYDRIIATQPEVTRKGATMPYTSLNGHMFSFSPRTGTLRSDCLRSSAKHSWPATRHTYVSSTGRC